jgi:23S rRNA (cytidine1920-2'-O)/16S rRNA (cytidine1409-2'-O)-methyltransferase
VKERLDKLLLDRGLAGSRERARALIMEGRVLVGHVPVTKAGTMVAAEAEVSLKGEDIPYVSRGGLKIEHAVEKFGIEFEGKVVLDVGASTGGFTDFALQRGAARVYAVDVGYGQLHERLRTDPRVVVRERTNARYLTREDVPEDVDLAVVDVSFISLLKVMPRVREFLRPGGVVVALVKPQFEAGRGEVGKGGVVRDETVRLEAVRRVREGLSALGMRDAGVVESPVRGQKGNVEYFLVLIDDRESRQTKEEDR